MSLIIAACPSVGGVDGIGLCLTPAGLTLNVVRNFERRFCPRAFQSAVSPLAGAAGGDRDRATRSPGLDTAERPEGHRHRPG